MDKVLIGDIQVDVDDLKDMNTTELVTLCRSIGLSAHRGVERHVLTSALKGRKRKMRNKVDDYRVQIIDFLEAHWGAVSSQVDLKCDGNCNNHTDFQVVTCWKTNKETMERHS